MAKKKRPNLQQAADADDSADIVTSGAATDRRYIAAVACILGLCLVVYFRTVFADFINFDDDAYVYENPNVLGGLSLKGIYWALTAVHSSNWHPLTWISHQLDVSLFGPNAAGHHAVNVLLHSANSVILFFFLRQITGAFWRSAVVAAIFAVHPVHVESVAWISERKDVLSTLFWLLSSIFYVRWAKGVGGSAGRRDYLITLGLFVAGLAAKPMVVTLPFVFLLLDIWPLGRVESFSLPAIWKLVREKVPFFVFSAASAVITVIAQGSSGAIQSTNIIPLTDRFANAIVSYVKYVLVMFNPTGLGVWYPFESGLELPLVASSAVVLIAITAAAVHQWRVRPYLFAGWFWFVGTLVPVIGILQVGRQSMADRYTYIPHIGLSIALVWLGSELLTKARIDKRISAAVTAAVVIALTIIAFIQVSYWQNSETIYQRTLSIAPKNYLIKNNYCNYLERKNRFDEAAAQCLAAIADDGSLPDAYNNLGTVRLKQNRLEEARSAFVSAVERKPDFVYALTNLASVSANLGDIDAAAEALEKAMRSDTGVFFDNARVQETYFNLGAAAMKQKRYDRAAESFRKVIEAVPTNIDAKRNLGLSLHMQGRSAEGIRELEETIRKFPNSAESYNTLGLIFADRGQKQEAAANFQKALSINPNFVQAQANLRKLNE